MKPTLFDQPDGKRPKYVTVIALVRHKTLEFQKVNLSPCLLKYHKIKTYGRLRYSYREDFYFVDRFHGSALHGERGATCREAHMKFAYGSACLMAESSE
jgi:hypothetical protein